MIGTVLQSELQTQRAATVRTTIITAVKVIIREQAQYLKKGRNADESVTLDALLHERIPILFKTLDEGEEMKTRQQALVTLNTLAHNRTHLVNVLKMFFKVEVFLYADSRLPTNDSAGCLPRDAHSTGTYTRDLHGTIHAQNRRWTGTEKGVLIMFCAES